MNRKKIILFVFIFFVLPLIFYWVFISSSCEQNFNTYPEAGYCEFDLKMCEGAFGCKKYNKVRISCGSEFTLCSGKGFCDCGKGISANPALDN